MALNHVAAQLALRARALTLSVATTGSASLAQTTTGFTRAAGSFVTDGFVAGMEVTPTGFAANTVGIVTDVSALTLSVTGTRTAEIAAAGRTLSVGIPALRAWENKDLQPVSGRPYLEEEYVPATLALRTTCAQGGTVEETGLYVLKWYGLANYGISAIRASIDAAAALFTPGTAIAVGATTVHVRSDVGPFAGQLLPIDGGWTVVTLTIPWKAWTINVVAA